MPKSSIPGIALLALLGLVACGDDPSDPGDGSDSDVHGFSVRRAGAEIYAWDPDSFSQADTLRLGAADSIAVEFRWLDSDGEPVTVSAANADLTVTMANQGVARWRPDASSAFRGSIITGNLLQPVATAMRVQLVVSGETVLETSQLPIKVSP